MNLYPMSQSYLGTFNPPIFPQETLDKLDEEERRLQKWAYVPLIGLFCTALYEIKQDRFIKDDNRCDAKIILHKRALRIWQSNQICGVIVSIALTILYSCATYFESRSLKEAKLAAGVALCTFYTLLTLPTYLGWFWHQRKLSQEQINRAAEMNNRDSPLTPSPRESENPSPVMLGFDNHLNLDPGMNIPHEEGEVDEGYAINK